ncbi:MAG: ribosomal protein S18-alanine N-acetyltransferase [Candidatus Nealsonbacteria bacterium]
MQTIRLFSSTDLDKIIEIEKTSFSQPWSKSEFKKYESCFFVAEEKGEIIGFVLGRISKTQGTIKKIAVNQEYRGQGIGQALLEKILEIFKKQGVKEAIARVRLDNKISLSFLKKTGFKTSKTIEKYYLDGTDAYFLKKEF